MKTQNKQWTIEVDETTGEYKIYNLSEDGTQQFYRVEAGQYGQPVIIAEPDLAFTAPTLNYVDVDGHAIQPGGEKVAGIICQNGPRLSLSNAARKGIVVKVNDDASIQVDDETWHIATLFCKDKNRVVGFDAYLTREKPRTVRILELGDLDLF